MVFYIHRSRAQTHTFKPIRLTTNRMKNMTHNIFCVVFYADENEKKKNQNKRIDTKNQMSCATVQTPIFFYFPRNDILFFIIHRSHAIQSDFPFYSNNIICIK